MNTFQLSRQKLLTILLLILTLAIDLAFSDKTSNLFRKRWLNQNHTGKIVINLAEIGS